MRIFADPSSLDHWAKQFAHCPIITLDGKTLTQVIMADDQKSIVEIVSMEGDKPRVDENSGMICTTFLRGKVEIIGRPIGQPAN